MKRSIFIFILFVCTVYGFAQFKNASYMVNGYALPYLVCTRKIMMQLNNIHW